MFLVDINLWENKQQNTVQKIKYFSGLCKTQQDK